MNKDDVLSIDQVAELLGVSARTVRNWLDAVEMNFPRPVPFGPRLKRWRRGEVQAWLESRRVSNISPISSGNQLAVEKAAQRGGTLARILALLDHLDADERAELVRILNGGA